MITATLTAAISVLTLAQAAQDSGQKAPAPAPSASPAVSLTIYSTADVRSFDPQRFIEQQRSGWDAQSAWSVPGFGVVRDTRRMSIPKGTGWVEFGDVAQFMDPTTVLFTDLDDAKTVVLEQKLEFDLVNGDKLMQKYLNQMVRIETTAGNERVVTSGTLLSANSGQAVLMNNSGIVILPTSNATVTLVSLPKGLRVKPSLLWNTESEAGGEHRVRVDYQTGGLTWRADYNLAVAADEKTAALAAWVTLLNVSGTTYPDAELRLIAGDVHRVRPEERAERMMMARGGLAAADAKEFKEESLGEYHRYTLPRQLDVPSNSTQQLTLFPTAQNLKVRKELVTSGWERGGYAREPFLDGNDMGPTSSTVGVYYTFENTEGAGLGLPLPAGKVRVSQADGAGSAEFIGEDVIGHTARGQPVRLFTGTSFDVTSQRTRTNFKVNGAGREAHETFAITVKNGKQTPVTVLVRENLWRWSGWTIENANVDGKAVEPEKTSATVVTQQVTVPAGGKTVFTYTVHYSW